jgi:uncharacterized protein (TIGR00369 family)
MTPVELSVCLAQAFPDFYAREYVFEEVTEDALRVRRHIGAQHLRPGGTVLGPVLMELCDLASYFCVVAPLGPGAVAFTTSLTIHFLRPPKMADVIAHARVLKRGKRLAVIEVSLLTDGEDSLVAHATATFAFPEG